jgi:hypothetical protein
MWGSCGNGVCRVAETCALVMSDSLSKKVKRDSYRNTIIMIGHGMDSHSDKLT